MSRLSDTAPRQTISGLPCSVQAAIDELDPESRADMTAWLAGERPDLGSDTDMWHRLQALGFRVGRQTVGRHRRGDCRCTA